MTVPFLFLPGDARPILFIGVVNLLNRRNPRGLRYSEAMCPPTRIRLSIKAALGVLMRSKKFFVILDVGLASGCALFENTDSLLSNVVEIEKRLDARIGIMVIDEEIGRVWERNSVDRFSLWQVPLRP